MINSMINNTIKNTTSLKYYPTTPPTLASDGNELRVDKMWYAIRMMRSDINSYIKIIYKKILDK